VKQLINNDFNTTYRSCLIPLVRILSRKISVRSISLKTLWNHIAYYLKTSRN